MNYQLVEEKACGGAVFALFKFSLDSKVEIKCIWLSGLVLQSASKGFSWNLLSLDSFHL